MLKIIFFSMMGAFVFCGCKKYLDEKSNSQLVVPNTLTDLQAMLDYNSRINQFDPGSGEASADDYYLLDADYSAIASENERRMYTWEKDNLFAPGLSDWSYTYDNVYRANSILEVLHRIERTQANARDWDNVKGQALFIRAKAFLQAAIIWAPAYDEQTAATDLGLPLRLSSDFNLASSRSSVKETYAQIISDLRDAVPVLPNSPVHVMRASKPAAYAMIARCFLAMRDYDKAGLYADSCLRIYTVLLDYNTVNASANFPFTRFNSEVIMESFMRTPTLLGKGYIDSALYRSYATNDLRKSAFFKTVGSNFSFKGSYEGSAALFDGIATDEVLLMRAEVYARQGNVLAAMSDLNSLLVKRYKSGTFVALTASSGPDALNKVLLERRKELLMRGLRWMDIKRLNKEGAGIVPARMVKGVIYTLSPNEFRYALPIPDDVISLSGMQQNPR